MRKKLFQAAVVAASFLAAPAADAAPGDLQARMTEILARTIAEKDWPGATAAVVLADGTTVEAAAGVADRRTGQKLRSDDRMPAGSIGKTFAAAAAMKLAEAGKLRLDAPIARYVGGERWFRNLPGGERWTTRMLLQHRTCLADHIYVGNWLRTYLTMTRQDRDFAPSFAEDIDVASSAGPSCKPGHVTEYTDTGYLIVGLIDEKLAGESFYRYFDRAIARPLGLDRTIPSDRRDVPVVDGEIEPGAAALLGGDHTIGADGKLIYNPGFEFTGGGFASNPRDLARFMKALFEGRIVKPSSVEAMLQGVPMEWAVAGHQYGLGVQIFDTEVGKVWGHTGQLIGYRSFAVYYPERRIAVAFQINKDAKGLLPLLNQLAHAALE